MVARIPVGALAHHYEMTMATRDGPYPRPWVAVVAGGSSGIGLASARRLLAAGAEVVIGGVDSGEVDAAVSALRADDPAARVRGVAGDCSEPAGAASLIEAAAAAGPLRVLVDSVGIQRYGTVEETTVETFDEVLAVNLRTAFLLCKFAVPRIRAHGGAIVIVSSVQAFAAQSGVVAYAASKAALLGLVRATAVDHARDGVRVNAVCPGSVDTPMLRSSAGQFAPAGREEELLRTWGEMHPLGRVALPEEIAEAVWFLASPQASFISGTELEVDGGLLASLGVKVED
jgi:NAD(P)-dependent dehydrogenase (short-subunit alcohol dehydrogenase family)